GGTTNLGQLDPFLRRHDAGPLNVVGQPQVSGQLQALAQTASQPGQSAQVTFQAVTNDQLTRVINATNTLPSAPVGTLTVTVNLPAGDYGGQTIDLPANVTLIIHGESGTTTFVGHSPALMVVSGTVLVDGATFTNATAAATILVNG